MDTSPRRQTLQSSFWPDMQWKAKPHINDVINGSGGLPAHEVQALPDAGGAVADSRPGHRGYGAPRQLVGWICSTCTR